MRLRRKICHMARSSCIRSALTCLTMLGACAPQGGPVTAGRPAAPGDRASAPEPRPPEVRRRAPAPAPAPVAERPAPPRRPRPWAPSAALAKAWQEGAWLQDRADPRGTGATTAAPVRVAPRILWRHAAQGVGEIAGPVVAGGGLVFFGTSSGAMRALDVASGRERWSRAEKGEILAAPSLGTGTGEGTGEGAGTLFAVLSETGTLVAFKAASGERLYERVVVGPVLGAPLLADGRIYLGSGAPGLRRAAGAIHALVAATGKPLWKRSTGSRRKRTVKRTLHLAGVSARPSVSADGVVWATSQDGFVHAVIGRNGRSMQREMIERQAAYTPAVDGNIAYFHRGGQLFTLGGPRKILGLLKRPPKPLAAGLGSPALTAARIYVAGDGALVAMSRDALAGEAKGREAAAPLWRYPLPEQTSVARHSAPVVAGAGSAEETVYMVDAQGTLHAVDGATGKALWKRELRLPAAPAGPGRPRATAAPALLPHLLLVSTPRGEVLALTDAR